MGLTTDPESPCLKVVEESGQNACYLVLSEEERAKGFVRPFRKTYIHVGLPPPVNKLHDLTEEEAERYKEFSYVKFEKYPATEGSVVGRYWTQDQLDKVNKGCGVATTMASAIAETYARDNRFYGQTFCVHCGKHFRVDEFVWEGTTERVGS